MSSLTYLPISLTILFFILLSAIFSASETALIAASKAKLHRLSKKGSNAAKMVMSMRLESEKLIGTILLCNSLANIVSASLATYLFTKFWGETGVWYATALMTFLIVIYAEVMPKIFAISFAESLAIFLAPSISFLIKITSPITFFIEKMARWSLRLMGVKIDPKARITSSEEELRGAIDLHEGSPESRQEKAMMHSILDLGDVHVDEIMVHRSDVTMLDADSDPSTIIEMVTSSPFTRIPLWEENTDNIIGILNAKDLLRAIRFHNGNLQNIKIKEIVNKPWFVPETTTLHEQLQAFRDRKEHFAIVVDEYGAFIGIVTLEDILEEIVGEISDEHDIQIPGIWGQMNGDIFVTGSTTLRDLNRQFDWALPDIEASTIAGLVLHEARKIPKVGQTFNIKGFRIKVIRRVRNKLTLLRISSVKKV